MSLHSLTGDQSSMINFDTMIPKLLNGRGLSRLIYFREGNNISSKLAERLLNNFMGSVVPCHKSADIPLTISATQIARKVDTIIVLSGDSDYVELVRHLKGEGVRVEIAAVQKTTAAILIEEADHFVPIGLQDSFSLNKRRYNSTKSVEKKQTKSVSKTKPSTKRTPIKKSVGTKAKSSIRKTSKPKSTSNKTQRTSKKSSSSNAKARSRKTKK